MRAEENLQLQEQVLRLRADVGRERVENTSLTERLAQAETRVSAMGAIVIMPRGSIVQGHACVFDLTRHSIIGRKPLDVGGFDDTRTGAVSSC